MRISPIGSRTAAVRPACAQMKASLACSTVLMPADSSPEPGLLAAGEQRCVRWLVRSSSSPNVMLAGAQAAAGRFPAGR